MEKDNNAEWNTYYEKASKKPPSTTLLKALSFFKNKSDNLIAYDLGAGTGRDSFELIKNDFFVFSIDNNPSLISYYKEISKKFEKLVFKCCEIEKIKLENADLINASLSLPFVKRDFFYDVMDNIKNGIKEDGIFCGHFFGTKDEWKSLTLLEKDEIKEIFSDWTFLSFIETEGPKTTASGVSKYTHIIQVVVRKKSSK